MHRLFIRAKPDDAELLPEIQSLDPAILVTIRAGGSRFALPMLAHKVVNWLQVSPVFMSTTNTNNSIKRHGDFITCLQKCRDPPHRTVSLWNRYVDKYFSDEDESDEDDSDDDSTSDEDDSNSR